MLLRLFRVPGEVVPPQQGGNLVEQLHVTGRTALVRTETKQSPGKSNSSPIEYGREPLIILNWCLAARNFRGMSTVGADRSSRSARSVSSPIEHGDSHAMQSSA